MGSIEAPISHQLLPTLFENRARLNPNGIYAKVPLSNTSYGSGFRSITHHEALIAIDCIAWILEESFGKCHNFETIAYMGPNDPRSHFVLIAGMKVGYKTFTPSPRNSKAAQHSLLARLECTKLICTDPEVSAVSVILDGYDMQKIHIPSLKELVSLQNVESYRYDKDYEEERNNPIFVLHTSGSTGIPKPLIYTHEWVTRIVNTHLVPDPEGYTMQDAKIRTGNFYISLPTFHISGVGFSLICPAFFDCVPVYPLPNAPPTLEALIGAVSSSERGEIDWIFVPPVVMDDLSRSPDLLELVASKIKYAFFIGGSLSQKAGDIVSQKLPLHQGMGSSECGPFVLLRPIQETSLEDWNYMQIHPALSLEFQPRIGDLHELVQIRGPEYLQPIFTHFPELQEYQTRDLFTPHPTKPGLWKHRSRVDDVIVFLNGEKTNPISFEQEVGRHAEIRAALVVGQQRFEASLLIEPLNSSPLDSAQREELVQRLWPTVQSANTKCPAHARVSRSKIIFTDPNRPMLRAGKGTVIRQGTLMMYQKELDDLYSATAQNGSGIVVDINDHEAVLSKLQELVRDVTEWEHLENDADFFSKGMDSLQVLRLTRELNAVFPQRSILPATVYTNATIILLAKALSGSFTGEPASMAEWEQNRLKSLSEMRYKYESEIDSLASSMTKVVKLTNGHAQESRVVLLTGSTGALGSYILQNLLADGSVSHIYCLNRGQGSRKVQEQRNAERKIPAEFPASKVTFVYANLSLPNFGLEKPIYEQILSTVTHIVHNAWPVNFNQTLKSFQPSLDGVLALVAFSTQADVSPPILFISSISSAINHHNANNKDVLIPETVLEDDSAPAPTGYGESKYTAERLLDYASRRLGLSTSSVRVGQIAGTAQNPRGWNRNEWLPSLVLSSRHIGALPDTLGPKGLSSSGVMNSINWIPIDQLADILIELSFGLSKDPASDRMKVYHAVNPYPITWDKLLPTVQKSLQDTISQTPASLSKTVEIVSLPEWVERLQSTSTAVTDSRMSVMSKEMVYQNPGIKLLEFYQSLTVSDESAPSCELDIQKSLEASRSLKGLEPIREEWMDGWVKNWVAGLQ